MSKITNIPNVIKETGKFCLHINKVPYNPHNEMCGDPRDVKTFGSFEETYKVYSSNLDKYDGMGVKIFGSLAAIDIDDCITDGKLSSLAEEIIAIMDNSYVEISPSGKGLRILFEVSDFDYDKNKYYINNQNSSLEVYLPKNPSRYVTVTGNKIGDGDFGDRTEQIKIVLEKFMIRNKSSNKKDSLRNTNELSLEDEELIEIARAAKNAPKFQSLWEGDISGYPSQSEADLALCEMLAFYSQKNPAQIDRIFRLSELYKNESRKDKWDSQRGEETYGNLTISKAIELCESVYDPHYFSKLSKNDSVDGSDKNNISTILAELKPEVNPKFSWDDIGNAKLFSEVYKDKIKYIEDEGCWYVYDGTMWKPELGTTNIMGLLANLAESLRLYSDTIVNKDLGENYRKHIRDWSKRKTRVTILEDSKTYCRINSHEFDLEPYLLNCENGVLNLKTKKLYPHNSSYLMSKKTNTKYDPSATSERFKQFISEITEGNEERAKTLQKVLGYSLLGEAPEECLFIALGNKTRNGKGTLFDTFRHLLGSYGGQMDFSAIAKSSFIDGSKANPELIRLKGLRFVLTNEPSKGALLNESLIKQMTGRDIITARPLYQNVREFKFIGKLIMTVNSLPNIYDDSLFKSDRIKILLFNKHFSEEERDLELKNKFQSPIVLSAILNWALEGLELYFKEGLKNTSEMDLLVAQYREKNDYVDQFLKEKIELLPLSNMRINLKLLHNKYCNWCETIKVKPLPLQSFKEDLRLKDINFHEYRHTICIWAKFKEEKNSLENCS